ncbi:MAG: hypothetical protein U0871_13860 [Gemmataceae bacterium]
MKRVVFGGLVAAYLAALVGCGGTSSSTTTFDKRGTTGQDDMKKRAETKATGK